MSEDGSSPEQEVLQRLDRSSPDRLLRSIAAEIARIQQAVARCEARIAALEARSAALSPHVVIDAESAIDHAHGFHQLEHDGDGKPMRWTGPDPDFRFELAIDRAAPRPIALGFARFYVDVVPLSLRAEADGGEIALCVEPLEGDGFVARGELPARPGRGVTALRFICPKTGSPRDDGGDDDRVLGLLFRRLEVGAPEAAAGAAGA